MRQINKAKSAEITKLHQTLVSVKSEYDDMIEVLEADIQKLVSEFHAKNATRLRELETAYNKTVEQMCDIVSDQTNSMQEYMSERTDTWHEGKAGTEYCFWFELWDEFARYLSGYGPDFNIEINLERLELEPLPAFSPKSVAE